MRDLVSELSKGGDREGGKERQSEGMMEGVVSE